MDIGDSLCLPAPSRLRHLAFPRDLPLSTRMTWFFRHCSPLQDSTLRLRRGPTAVIVTTQMDETVRLLTQVGFPAPQGEVMLKFTTITPETRRTKVMVRHVPWEIPIDDLRPLLPQLLDIERRINPVSKRLSNELICWWVGPLPPKVNVGPIHNCFLD